MLLKISLLVCVILGVVSALFFISLLRKSELEFNEKKAILIKENMDLKDKFESLEKDVSEKLASMEKLQKEKELFEERLSLIKNETAKIVESYVKQLDKLKRKNAVYMKKISTLEKSSKSATPIERVKEAISKENNRDIKKVLEDTLRKLELIKAGKSVSLEPIIVAPVSSDLVEKSDAGKTGSVLSVDRANSLIVINLGRKDGLAEGDSCKVLFNGQSIAEADVVSVRYSIAASHINLFQPKYGIEDINDGTSVLVMKK